MRLWSLDPKYLDQRGLVALWREALLAQAVLSGQTKGYTRHPQLKRFRGAADPVAAICAYLKVVQLEACHRGYSFDDSKISITVAVEPIKVTKGQLLYEALHLRKKLETRAPLWLAGLEGLEDPQPHPLFYLVPGDIEDWEIR